MKALLLLVLLPGCAMFDPMTIKAPAAMCILGHCAQLQPAIADLNSPEMTARLCAAGAMIEACRK